jgi:large conductance mechanosensitive channel
MEETMLKEFKKFALRGNVVDLAIGVIIGASFGAIVTSLVKDIIMPPIGLLLGGLDFANMFAILKAGTPGPPYASLADAQGAGAVTINYGVFINALVNFVIVAVVIFLLVRAINRLQRQKEEEPPAAPTTRECPFCLSVVPLQATRCAFCTSEIGPQ